MPQNSNDVTNPGLVDVADQGDGLVSVDQSVVKSPSSNPGPLVSASNQAPGTGTASQDQPVTVSEPASTALLTVDADVSSPQSANTINTTENTAIDQIVGSPNPPNVYV
jgi:hypothetical protein